MTLVSLHQIIQHFNTLKRNALKHYSVNTLTLHHVKALPRYHVITLTLYHFSVLKFRLFQKFFEPPIFISDLDQSGKTFSENYTPNF